MSDFLVFQLYGPLCSWGGVAVGQERPTETHPTKSAIVGIIAAALGVRREDENAQRELIEGYGLAIRTELPGVLERDYHTAESPSSTSLVGMPHITRRDELKAVAQRDNAIVSSREYRTDALNLVAIWEHSEAPHSLDNIAQAIKSPYFTLYLGRKSFTLSLPLNPTIVSSNNLRNVFAKADIEFSDSHPFLAPLFSARNTVIWQWDSDFKNSGFDHSMEIIRRDVPLNRERWQFTERTESQFVETPTNSSKGVQND